MGEGRAGMLRVSLTLGPATARESLLARASCVVAGR